MSVAVATCSKCTARVNIHWKTCLVCRTPIEGRAHHEEQAGTVPMPGARIAWMGRDGNQVQGRVVEVLIDLSVDAPITVLVALHDGSEVTLNPRTVKLWVLNDPQAGPTVTGNVRLPD